MVRGWWSAISSISLRSGLGGQPLTSSSRDEGPERKRREKTQREHTQETHRKHRQKHRQKTQRENTDRKHRQKTQRENADRNTDRKHADRKQKTQRENTERKHREKTQTENTQTENGNTQRENTDRSATQYYKVLHNTIPYYKAPLRRNTTQCYTVLHVGAGDRAQDLLLPRLTPYPRGKFSGTAILKRTVIANTMRGAIPQIQNTRPVRGAIPRAQNLRFATVSRDRPTESYERARAAKSNVCFARAACRAQKHV